MCKKLHVKWATYLFLVIGGLLPRKPPAMEPYSRSYALDSPPQAVCPAKEIATATRFHSRRTPLPSKTRPIGLVLLDEAVLTR